MLQSYEMTLTASLQTYINFIIPMNDKFAVRKKSKLKSQFKMLIDNLRNKTMLRQRSQTSSAIQNLLNKPLQSPTIQQSNDILPVTQYKNQTTNHSHHQLFRTNFQQSSQLLQNNKERFNSGNISQIYLYSDSQDTVKQRDQSRLTYQRGAVLLKPQQKIILNERQVHFGQIKRQNHSVNGPQNIKNQIERNIFSKIKFIDIPLPSSSPILQLQRLAQSPKSKIKDINDIQIVKYWNSKAKLTQKSQSSSILLFFQGLLDELNIQIANPIIKKYVNCIYFGSQPLKNTVYEGFISYYEDKLYYGELQNGIKQGHGVQINFKDNVKYAGNFQQGKKIGHFNIQKDRQNYEGLVEHGIYQGMGKLMTQDCIYCGNFENGKKNGYGEDYFPKTGLKLKGIFKDGQFQNLNNSIKLREFASEDQLSSKVNSLMTKSNSSHINFNLLLKKRENSNTSYESYHPIVRHEDSKSLFDLMTKGNKINKYDMQIQNVSQKFPKIYIEGVLKRQFDPSNQEEIIFRKQPKKTEESRLIQKRYFSQQKPINITNSTKIVQNDDRLAKHKSRNPLI